MERTIMIDGMHCRSCKEIIADELAGMDCVVSAEVSLEEGSARVSMREDCTEAILEAIDSLGYKAKVQ